MPLLSERTWMLLDPPLFVFAAYYAAAPKFILSLLSLLTSPFHSPTAPALNAPPSTLYPTPTKSTPGTFLANLHALLFYHAWASVAHDIDGNSAEIKGPLLASCTGVVLEIGAGVGDNFKYYRRENVTRLVAVEPNAFMHDTIREKALAAGFKEVDGSLVVLGCGGSAADEPTLVSALGGGDGVIDAVVCVHVLCSVPGVPSAVEMYRRMLRSGGRIVFYEHVRSKVGEVVWWQSLWEKLGWVWLMSGCELTKRTGDIIVGDAVGEKENGDSKRWREWELKSPEGRSEWACVPIQFGYAIKP